MLQTQTFIFTFYVPGKALSARDTSTNRDPCPLGANNLVRKTDYQAPGLPLQNVQTKGQA